MTKSLIEDFAAIKLGLKRIEDEKAAERARPAPDAKPENDTTNGPSGFDWSAVLAQNLSDIYGC